MELCCREGPDGGAGPRGKNPRKWLAVPGRSGLPLNGCMPRVAWQQLGASSRSVSSTTRHGGCANNGRRVGVGVDVVVRLLLPAASAGKQPAAAEAAMDRSSGGTRLGTTAAARRCMQSFLSSVASPDRGVNAMD
ncbi:hypothetical protein ZEAMMB73_Zm00001d050672 [Zea mays]|jgi:hypothetical protein|uniref:Uncharacterized protein n=1 Tax=Zea mays TaxID=4577 RepID=A0A1D6Q2V5_MAIZE|nr:hypothetical protein ZEAMMB73_Zm00001d050672 [Zea mays]